MKKKRKGFTLIELLAVIVILGLLMAIAIPSVTKYITQSRKKTVTSTIGNYIGALVNDVNDLSYTFTETNTVYAVPIECIALERGGTNPFGAWHQASNAYWAYVLVQYDDNTSSYTYGYTFKDSAGYGLYPTAQPNLNEQGKQIQTGLSLTRPKNGKVTTITAVANWSGFKVDGTTNLVVLEAESEGNTGDGKTTCTLQQKGDNYAIVEQEKNNSGVNKPDVGELLGDAYALYFDSDKSLTFVRSDNVIKVGDIYDGKTITKVYANFENQKFSSYSSIPWYSIRTNIVKVVVKDVIKPVSTLSWFEGFQNCSYLDVSNLDTSLVTDMSYMFFQTGMSVTNFKIVGLNNWNTSKVTNMEGMFNRVGMGASTWQIGDLSNWQTSNVTNMKTMFNVAGASAQNFNIGNLDNWDISKVTNMSAMFGVAGYNAVSFNIGDLSKWNTSNVTDMSSMFNVTANSATSFDIGDLSKWNTSNVTDMSSMFNGTAGNATWYIDCSSWDTSKVINYESFNHMTNSNIRSPKFS